MNSGMLQGGTPIRYRIEPIGGEGPLFRVSLGLDDDSIECTVRLVEQKPSSRTPAQHSDQLAELVCSNSFRGAALHNAVG